MSSPFFCGPYPKRCFCAQIRVRRPGDLFKKEGEMKLKAVAFFSGFAMTMVTFLLLWHVIVVALLIHGIDEVIGVFGGLL